MVKTWKRKGPTPTYRHHCPRLWSRKPQNKWLHTLCMSHMSILAMSASVPGNSGNMKPTFDTDSFDISIDTGASFCLSHVIGDFVGPVKPIKRSLQGIGTQMTNLSMGTLKWTFDDDDGRSHTFIIPKSIYAPQADRRLLSPQHWAKSQDDNKPKPNGTWCATYADSIVLHWKQGKFQRTCQLTERISTLPKLIPPQDINNMLHFVLNALLSQMWLHFLQQFLTPMIAPSYLPSPTPSKASTMGHNSDFLMGSKNENQFVSVSTYLNIRTQGQVWLMMMMIPRFH